MITDKRVSGNITTSSNVRVETHSDSSFYKPLIARRCGSNCDYLGYSAEREGTQLVVMLMESV